MITFPPARSFRSRSALAVGAAALICASLAACSSSGGPTPATTGNAQPASAPNPSSGSGTSASDPAAASASGSACGLVTVSEVTTATGKPMAAGTGTGDFCSFSATGDPSLIVYIQVYASAGTLSVAKQEESSGQHVTGLGDDAFWTVAGNLFVQKGERGFTITLPSLALMAAAKRRRGS
jgi:hypothetical protein